MSTHRSRYRRIATILEHHGLGLGLGLLGLEKWIPFNKGVLGHARRDEPYTSPEHLRFALEELGPTFIKLGQLLSTRNDLLPAAYLAELAKLQDAAPPEDWEPMKAVIREELGADPEQLFAQFDPQPLAAASIGQAYAAILHDGTQVVVKVRRPGAVAQIHEDLEILQNLAERADKRWESARQYNLPGIVEEFSRTLRAELDYLQEGRNAERFAADFADSPDVAVPQVFWETTTSRVLTLERMHGIRVDDLPALDAAGIDRRQLARRGADLILTMVFENRFFHADPHPGNMFIHPDGSIALIDFGMVGQLDEEVTEQLSDVLLAFTRGDSDALATALLALSITKNTSDRGELGRSLDVFVSRYRGRPLSEIHLSHLLGELLAPAAPPPPPAAAADRSAVQGPDDGRGTGGTARPRVRDAAGAHPLLGADRAATVLPPRPGETLGTGIRGCRSTAARAARNAQAAPAGAGERRPRGAPARGRTGTARGTG